MSNFRSRTLTEYAEIIWRRKLMIFLITAGMSIATFLFIGHLPNVYEARATVVVSGELSDRQAVNARVAAAAERMNSRSFLVPIIERLDPYASSNVDSGIVRMRDDMKTDITYRSDFPERLSVTYRHYDPAMAKAVAGDLLTVFSTMNEAIKKQLEDRESSLAAEITGIENRLREMGKLRSALATRRLIAGRASGQSSAIRAQRIAAASSIDTLSDRQFALQQQIAEQKRQITEQEKIVKLAPSDTRASSSYGVLLVRKAELEGQLKDHSTQYTDKNPKVIQSRNQLTEINHQINQLNAGDQGSSPVNSAEARELRSMQREMTRLQTELTVTERELGRKKQSGYVASGAVPISTPAVGSAIDGNDAPQEVQTDYETLRKRYDAFLNRQEQLERSKVGAAGLEPGLFQIVDLPAEPRQPVGPNRLKYRLFALALALGVGLLVAIAVEIPRLYSISDDRDVEYYLGVPVIALIPETALPSEGPARRLLLGRAIGGLLVVIALVSAVLFVVRHTQIAALLR